MTVRVLSRSCPAPPKRRLHTCSPFGDSHARKMSSDPAVASGPPPRSIVPANAPVITAAPSPEAAIPSP